MLTKTADHLDKLTRKALMAVGADTRNANRVAEALTSSSLCGVDSHGIHQLPGYVESVQSGEIVPAAWPEILKEDATSARIRGNWTFGHVTAKYAMEVAIEKAKSHNLAIVSIVEANHIGRLGEYAEMAACQDMIGIIWAGGLGEEQPETVPFGGRQPILSTNPIGMGFPIGDGSPMIIDYATTVVAGSKIQSYKDKEQSLPSNSVVDKHGKPSNDPDAFLNGGFHLPFGGHKGYALMLAVELFGRIFSGADAFGDAERGGPIFRHSGATMMVVKADLFQPFADYEARAADLANRARATPTAPGFEEVLIPGDLETRTREIRSRNGIPIADSLWKRLVHMAKSLGLDMN